MMLRLTLSVFCALAVPLPAAAQGDLTLVIEPYVGSEERVPDRVFEEFGRTDRITGFVDRKVRSETFEGRILLMRFRNPADRSILEILTNYQQALEERGFDLGWQCESRAGCGHTADGGWVRRNGMNLGAGGRVSYFTGQMPFEGGTVFVSVGVEPSNHYVQILQADDMDTEQVRVLDAAAMAASLDTQGRIAIENIYFDFGKADLLPTSDEAITEIARLLTDRPDAGLYVVGHTDSVGSLDANQALSLARASAVVRALETSHGIAQGRVVPAGVGPLAPVASNTTDAGRALNRRVEIVLR